MTQQTIDVGTSPNNGTGDTFHAAFNKTNLNFTDLYTTSYASNAVTSLDGQMGNVTLATSDFMTAIGYVPLPITGGTITGSSIFQGPVVVGGFASLINLNAASPAILPPTPTNSLLQLYNVDTTSTVISIDSYVNAGNPNSSLTLRCARGTGSSTTAIQNGDIIGTVSAIGYGATLFQAQGTGTIAFISEGNFTNASQPMAISFSTATALSTTETLRITSAGVFTLSGNIAATNSITGTLTAAGGMGVSNNFYVGGTANAPAYNTGSFTSSNVTFTGGTIDSATIGGTTPSTGKVTTLTVTGTISFTTPMNNSSAGTGLSAIPVSVLSGNSTALNSITPGALRTTLISAGASAQPVFGFPTGTLLNIQAFTASGTYTPTSGTNSIVVECQGAGGGGGGVAATSGTQYAAAGGGSGGTFARVRITSVSSQTVTVGAAGAAGTAGANAGGLGGTSSFGALVSCPGGPGGSGGGAITNTNNQTTSTGGGISTAATISGATTINTFQGMKGSPGIQYNSSNVISGGGGNSAFGFGGYAKQTSSSTPGIGTVGSGYGAGASGSVILISVAAQVGAAGSPGVVIVYEYA